MTNRPPQVGSDELLDAAAAWTALHIATPDAIRRIQRVQTVTIAWMSVEAVVFHDLFLNE